MTATEWRSVVDFPDYEVSNLGEVASYRRIRRRFLRPGLASNGYLTVKLYGSDPRCTRTVHSIVAAAFIGPRPTGLEVCHCDGDRLNNRASNLRYDTRSGNNRDRRIHGTDPYLNRTHCSAGHPYNELNTYRAPGTNRRYCRPCNAAANRRSRAARREQAA